MIVRFFNVLWTVAALWALTLFGGAIFTLIDGEGFGSFAFIAAIGITPALILWVITYVVGPYETPDTGDIFRID